MHCRFPYACLTVLLSASLALSWGCGGRAITEKTSEGDLASETRVDCVQGVEGASLVDGLELSQTVTALALFELTEGHELEELLQWSGNMCDGGPWGECVTFQEPVHGFYVPGQRRPKALLAERDGNWEALGYWQTRELLGRVDTMNEAAVVAFTEGWVLDCDDLRVNSGGYEFDTTSSCAPGSGKVTISIDSQISHSAFCSE